MSTVRIAAAGIALLASVTPALAQRTLPEVTVRAERDAPLNSDSPADSASRLGLKVREIPATVDIVDQETMRTRGL